MTKTDSEFGIWNANLKVSSSRQLVALGFAMLVAWLLVIALVADVSASDDSSERAANPELSAVERHTRSTSQSAAMAANPELAAAGRYTRGTSRSAAEAANLELWAAGRWWLSGPVSNPALTSGGAAGQGNDSSFLASNPEVMAARRYGSALSHCGLALGC